MEKQSVMQRAQTAQLHSGSLEEEDNMLLADADRY